MSRAFVRTSMAVLAIAAAACGGGGGGASGSSSTPAASIPSTVATFSIDSSHAGVSYPISVYVPPDSQAQTLPVIYALDAETRFNPLMSVMQDTGTRAILVGVGNTGGTRRQIDFLMPGADAYYRFVVEELVPVIESRYRADPSRRVLSGHSSSGLFVGYALFKEQPGQRRFAAFLCADPSFWQQPADVAQAQSRLRMAFAMTALPATFLLAGDAQGNLPSSSAMYASLLADNFQGLRLEHRTYNLGHVPMDSPFFRESLAIVLGAAP
jgi:predicted alpha/beta superfamily hydrolase